MKKRYLPVALAALILAPTMLSSCVGSFALTNSVLKWNNQVGGKFVNELVFFAFWILPVYEVTALADLIVLNSIEFWSGNNPMTASVKSVDTDHGRYLIACDGKGYTVTHEATGMAYRLDFDVPTQTWSVEADGQSWPLMTWLDSNHVRMATPDGAGTVVSIDEQGLQAYRQTLGEALPALAMDR